MVRPRFTARRWLKLGSAHSATGGGCGCSSARAAAAAAAATAAKDEPGRLGGGGDAPAALEAEGSCVPARHG